jgi:hypothetical protein
MNIKDLTIDHILQIIAIKKKIEKLHTNVEKRVEKLQGKIDSIAGGGICSSRRLMVIDARELEI